MSPHNSAAGHGHGDAPASAPASAAVATPARAPATGFVSGWKLEILRVLWVVAAFGTGIAFFAGLPREYAIASTLSRNSILRLEAIGLPATFPAWYLVVLDTTTFFIFVSVAVILFRRRVNDAMALVAAYLLLFTGMLYTAPGYEARLPIWMIALGASLAEIAQITFLLVFPTGNFSPPWTRWLLAPLAVWRFTVWYTMYIPWLYSTVRTGDNYPFLRQNPTDLLLYFAVLLFAVALQIRRYRRESDRTQRLQAKWLVWGTSIAILVVGCYVLALNMVPATHPANGSAVLMRLVGRTVRQIALCIVPVTMLYSVMRYRLWNIDFLINRTLVYVPLTSVLAGVFAVAMTFTQRFFVSTTGQTSEYAVIFTTLILTASFAPVRTELQATVDRHFKEAPDPTRGLKRFDERVEQVAEVLQKERLLTRLLDDTMEAFDATGGAVYCEEVQGEQSRRRLIKQSEGWTGEPELQMAIDSGGSCVGWLELGPRVGDDQYSEKEIARLHESLERVAEVILLLHPQPLPALRLHAEPQARAA